LRSIVAEHFPWILVEVAWRMLTENLLSLSTVSTVLATVGGSAARMLHVILLEAYLSHVTSPRSSFSKECVTEVASALCVAYLEQFFYGGPDEIDDEARAEVEDTPGLAHWLKTLDSQSGNYGSSWVGLLCPPLRSPHIHRPRCVRKFFDLAVSDTPLDHDNLLETYDILVKRHAKDDDTDGDDEFSRKWQDDEDTALERFAMQLVLQANAGHTTQTLVLLVPTRPDVAAALLSCRRRNTAEWRLCLPRFHDALRQVERGVEVAPGVDKVTADPDYLREAYKSALLHCARDVGMSDLLSLLPHDAGLRFHWPLICSVVELFTAQAHLEQLTAS